MKRSQLREIVLEAMRGATGTNIFRDVLQEVAKKETEKGDPVKGNKILDKANPKNVARILKGKKPIYEGDDQQTYVVHYRVGEDDDDDVEVKASSAEEAIEKAKSGKTAGGQNMPRLARSFSAKLK